MTAPLELNDDERLLCETVTELASSAAPVSRIRQYRELADPIGYSADLWSQLAELGFVAPHFSEAHGGAELGFFELCLVLRALGRQLAPEPFLSTVLLASEALRAGGTDAQKERWLPRVAAGDTILTVAYQEAGPRYCLDAVTTRAVASEGGGHSLTGEIRHVPDLHVADRILVVAQHAPIGGMTLYLVDPRAPGVRIVRQDRIDGRNVGILTLEGVVAEEVIGREGEGGGALRHVVDRATIGLAAEVIGSAEQAFDDTIAYLKTRRQFGVSIGSFQALQHRAARLYVRLACARSAVLAAARAVDEDPEAVPRMASLAKAQSSEVFTDVTSEGVQMFGGNGVTDEYDIGLYLKRARVADVTLGDPAWHRRRWAELGGY